MLTRKCHVTPSGNQCVSEAPLLGIAGWEAGVCSRNLYAREWEIPMDGDEGRWAKRVGVKSAQCTSPKGSSPPRQSEPFEEQENNGDNLGGLKRLRWQAETERDHMM